MWVPVPHANFRVLLERKELGKLVIELFLHEKFQFLLEGIPKQENLGSVFIESCPGPLSCSTGAFEISTCLPFLSKVRETFGFHTLNLQKTTWGDCSLRPGTHRFSTPWAAVRCFLERKMGAARGA